MVLIDSAFPTGEPLPWRNRDAILFRGVDRAAWRWGDGSGLPSAEPKLSCLAVPPINMSSYVHYAWLMVSSLSIGFALWLGGIISGPWGFKTILSLPSYGVLEIAKRSESDVK